MSTSAGAKGKTSGQASRELKSVGHKKVGGGILQERSGSQLNKKTSTPTSSGKKQQSLFGFKGFAQISKESNKTFSVFNDENAVSKSAKKSDNLTDRDSQTSPEITRQWWVTETWPFTRSWRSGVARL